MPEFPGSVSCTQLRARSVPFLAYFCGDRWLGLFSRTVSVKVLFCGVDALLTLESRIPNRTTSTVKVSCTVPPSEVWICAEPPSGLYARTSATPAG